MSGHWINELLPTLSAWALLGWQRIFITCLNATQCITASICICCYGCDTMRPGKQGTWPLQGMHFTERFSAPAENHPSASCSCETDTMDLLSCFSEESGVWPGLSCRHCTMPSCFSPQGRALLSHGQSSNGRAGRLTLASFALCCSTSRPADLTSSFFIFVHVHLYSSSSKGTSQLAWESHLGSTGVPLQPSIATTQVHDPRSQFVNRVLTKYFLKPGARQAALEAARALPLIWEHSKSALTITDGLYWVTHWLPLSSLFTRIPVLHFSEWWRWRHWMRLDVIFITKEPLIIWYHWISLNTEGKNFKFQAATRRTGCPSWLPQRPLLAHYVGAREMSN